MLPEPMNDVVCSSCQGVRCCINYRVTITPMDLYRLVKARALSPTDVAYLVRDPKGRPGDQRVYLGDEKANYDLCLRKKPVPAFPEEKGSGHACVFLVEFGDHFKRCGVYMDRPMVCRTFPTSSTERGVVVHQRDTCPPKAWSVERVDLPRAQILHGIWHVERAISTAFLERWNTFARQTPAGRRQSAGLFYFWVVNFFGAIDGVLTHWMSSTERQRRFVGAWMRTNAIGEPPLTMIHSELHDTFVEVFGEGWEGVGIIRHHLDQLEALGRRLIEAGKNQGQEVPGAEESSNDVAAEVGERVGRIGALAQVATPEASESEGDVAEEEEENESAVEDAPDSEDGVEEPLEAPTGA